MHIAEQCRVLRGTARHITRGTDANALRIELDRVGAEEDGNPVILFREDEWTGAVTPDTEFGCDYRIGVCLR